ncbi:MAG: VWA domain-containing protein [Bacilli bacterium]|nr:VWA domain-containing protein [Bacilli bacterium]
MKKIIYFIAIFFCLVSVVDADLKCDWEKNIVVPTEENSCVEDAKLSDTGEGCNVSVEATKTSKPESKDYTRVVKNTEDIPKITGGGKPYYVYVLIDDSGSMNQKKTKFVNKSLRSLRENLKTIPNCAGANNNKCKMTIAFFHDESSDMITKNVSQLNDNDIDNKVTSNISTKIVDPDTDRGYVTNMHRGLNKAMSKVNDFSGYIPFFVLISDGAPTAMDSSNGTELKANPMTTARIYYKTLKYLIALKKSLKSINQDAKLLTVGVGISSRDIMSNFLLNPTLDNYNKLVSTGKTNETEKLHDLIKGDSTSYPEIFMGGPGGSADTVGGRKCNNKTNCIAFDGNKSNYKGWTDNYDSVIDAGICFGAFKFVGSNNDYKNMENYHLEYRNFSGDTFKNVALTKDNPKTIAKKEKYGNRCTQGKCDVYKYLISNRMGAKNHICFFPTRDGYNKLKNSYQIRVRVSSGDFDFADVNGGGQLSYNGKPLPSINENDDKVVDRFEPRSASGDEISPLDNVFNETKETITNEQCVEKVNVEKTINQYSSNSCKSDESVSVMACYNNTKGLFRMSLVKYTHLIDFDAGTLNQYSNESKGLIAGHAFEMSNINLKKTINWDYKYKGTNIQSVKGGESVPLFSNDGSYYKYSDLMKSDCQTKLFSSENELESYIIDNMKGDNESNSLSLEVKEDFNGEKKDKTIHGELNGSSFQSKEKTIEYSTNFLVDNISMRNNEEFYYGEENVVSIDEYNNHRRFYYLPFGYKGDQYDVIIKLDGREKTCSLKVSAKGEVEDYFDYRTIDINDPFPKTGYNYGMIPYNWRDWYCTTNGNCKDNNKNILRLKNSYNNNNDNSYYSTSLNKIISANFVDDGNYAYSDFINNRNGSSLFVNSKYFDKFVSSGANGFCHHGSFDEDCDKY